MGAKNKKHRRDAAERGTCRRTMQHAPIRSRHAGGYGPYAPQHERDGKRYEAGAPLDEVANERTQKRYEIQSNGKGREEEQLPEPHHKEALRHVTDRCQHRKAG